MVAPTPFGLPDGRAIFYRTASQILRVSLSEAMVAGTPEVYVEAEVIDFDVFPGLETGASRLA